MKTITIRQSAAFIFCLLSVLFGQVQADDSVKESVITASLPERSISALVTELAGHDTLKRSIILMPGSPGIMKIESPETFALKGNFLIRTRKYWLDRETIVFPWMPRPANGAVSPVAFEPVRAIPRKQARR